MSGFQFVHVECYSRKSDTKGRSVGFVLDEASRTPGACEHVAQPGEPVVVFGKSIDGVKRLHEERVAAATATTKAGKTRKVRVDQLTLLTVIASHPSASGAEPEVVEAWQRRTVEWMRER